MDLAIGTQVEFGRPNGQKRHGEIVKVNHKTYLIKIVCHALPIIGGQRIRVSKSLVNPVQPEPVQEEPVPVEPVQEEPVQAEVAGEIIQAQELMLMITPAELAAILQVIKDCEGQDFAGSHIDPANLGQTKILGLVEHVREMWRIDKEQKKEIEKLRRENTRFKIIMNRIKDAIGLEL